MERINLAEKLASFAETWTPKVVGALNGQLVKVAKLEGEYIWHQHEAEDEMFLVVRGELALHIRPPEGGERAVTLRPGEFAIVPRGVEHKPVAAELVEVVLFEPAATRNSGDREHSNTLEPDELERI